MADVLRLIDSRVPRLDSENISSLAAAGRVLASPVRSAVNVPNFAKSAMDGFALRSDDAGLRRVVGESWPGRAFTGEVQSGEAVRITTGAAIPAGADSVVPLELAQESAGVVHLVAEAVRGKHIVIVGEDVAAGADALPAGRLLRPQDLGLLAAIGVVSVEVVNRPRVAIIATGNELLPPGSVPVGTEVVDSNSPMLEALITRDGGLAVAMGRVPDDRIALRDEIRESDADVVLISGGSSVGSEDHTAAAVAGLGELAVHGIAMKPGAPAGVGFLGNQVVFLLPGNPGACLAAYDLFAGRTIRILGGRNREMPYRIASAVLTTEVASRIGCTDVVRVKLVAGRATPIAGGPARLGSAVEADGFLLVPHDVENLSAGETVQVFEFDA
ncbi:MAG: molybdopterin molybdotransferase MoeA [Gemmataceae bacterium]